MVSPAALAPATLTASRSDVKPSPVFTTSNVVVTGITAAGLTCARTNVGTVPTSAITPTAAVINAPRRAFAPIALPPPRPARDYHHTPWRSRGPPVTPVSPGRTS